MFELIIPICVELLTSMYSCKSSPLITYERRRKFEKKVSKPNKKRVRIQTPSE